ncbi:hypothetical protein UFOVP125_33 [uncultured Caudovirales phage]|uniref:Uncharacterized protein n=1 Tax=uncultured Caudovirales phage TaxID=2100421 RepID=A0A6J5LET4_9CAUD|nr:hypothetical protein UFOVP125_33 [uncultured Caudovirales phage]
MFDSYQRIRLRDLAWREGDPKPDYTKANVRLDAYIAELQVQHPKLFHNSASLAQRVFLDKPMGTMPYSYAVRDYANSTLKMIENTK